MKDIVEMSDFELARWYALYEAVNFIADECDQRRIDFSTVRLEPLHIRKYVEKTCDIFARKLDEDRNKLQKSIDMRLREALLRGGQSAVHCRA